MSFLRLKEKNITNGRTWFKRPRKPLVDGFPHVFFLKISLHAFVTSKRENVTQRDIKAKVISNHIKARKSKSTVYNAPINVKPDAGGSRATHRNLTVTHIPRVEVLTGHHAFDLSISNSRREVNQSFLIILTITFCPGGGDFDNFF